MIRTILTVFAFGLAFILPRALGAQQLGDSVPNQFSPPSLRVGDPRSRMTLPGSVPGERPIGIEAPAETSVDLGPPVPLDTPVDRANYRLGPGDMVSVSLIGALNQTNTFPVSPEGTILVPTVGIVNVLGLSLNEAEARVRSQVLRYYRSVDVRLTLAQLRSFKVFVLGDVTSPGVRTATPATRVSEIVPRANSAGQVQRRVVLRHASGDSVMVDLARFLHTGDLSQNPTVRAGDVIFVPTTDETIQVFGRIAHPGTYAFRPGETLAELLLTANGSATLPADAADTIRILRYRNTRARETIVLSQAEARGARGQQLVMQPFDAVFIPALANFKEQATATAGGQVRHPGVYPIVPGVTTVRDLVSLAGGFTEQASLAQTTLRRVPAVTDEDSASALQNIPLEYLSDRDRRVRLADATGDRTYVTVDFEELFVSGQDAYDQPLQWGDVLFVPRKRAEITVVGAVVRPGIVQYQAGQPVGYFVALAGGYSKQAARSDVMVFKANRGNQVSWSDVKELEPGDRIVVPFKKPRTAMDHVQTVQAVVTTVSGLVLTVWGIARLF